MPATPSESPASTSTVEARHTAISSMSTWLSPPESSTTPSRNAPGLVCGERSTVSMLGPPTPKAMRKRLKTMLPFSPLRGRPATAVSGTGPVREARGAMTSRQRPVPEASSAPGAAEAAPGGRAPESTMISQVKDVLPNSSGRGGTPDTPVPVRGGSPFSTVPLSVRRRRPAAPPPPPDTSGRPQRTDAWPPSTGMSCPVMNRDASEARKTMTGPRSRSGSP